jgi:putative ABC transport system permease protein
MSFLSRLVNVFRSGRVDDDLYDELRFHLEQRTQALIAGGMDPKAAEAQARRGFGNRLSIQERSRDVKLLGWLDTLLKDARFGPRMLRNDFAVASAAVLSLSLAMGACIAAFAAHWWRQWSVGVGVGAVRRLGLVVQHPDQRPSGG